MKFRLLFLFSFFVLHIQAAQVIIIMGPSCAGKSTLSKRLCAAHLNVKNETWQRVDFDETEENIDLVIKRANSFLVQGVSVIIDTNTYKKDMETEFVGSPTVTKIIVTAPLQVLLEHEKKRGAFLTRTAQRVQLAREFVIESFSKSLTWSADLYIDSSAQSVQKSCEDICKFLKQ